MATGTQTGRVLNDGGPSSCVTPSTTSLATSEGSRAFNTHTFATGASAACVTASLTTSCALSQSVQFVAYLGSYDPANPVTNYLADYGSGDGGSGTITMSFNVAANSTFTSVEGDPGTAVGCTYSMTSPGPAL